MVGRALPESSPVTKYPGRVVSFEGNLDRLDGDIAQRGAFEEGVGLFFEGVHQPGIGRRAVEREIGDAIVVAGAVVRLPCADAMPGRRAGIANGRDAVARGHPLAVPPVDVTIRDAAHGGYAFAEVGAAVERKHQGPDAERLPHRVVAQQRSHRSRLLAGRWGGLLRRRALHRRATEEGGSAQTASAHGAATSEPLLTHGYWPLGGH